MRFAESTSVAIAIALVASCSGSTAQPARDGVPVDEQISRAPFALSYQPGNRGVDLVIRRAQSNVAARPADPATYAELARGFLRKQRETGDSALLAYAGDALAAAEQLAPRDPAVLLLRILLHRDSHRFADARDLAQRLVRIAPDDATGSLLLGDAELELGNYEAAVDAYQSALDGRPDLRSYSRAGHVRWLWGDVDGAMEMMEAALQAASARDPEPAAWCYADLGTMLLSRGKADAALRASERAATLVADYLPAALVQGKALARLGRIDEAIDALRSAAERQPNADTLLSLAELEDRAGRTDSARRWLERAEAHAPREPLPLALHHARHATQPARALELARAALAERQGVYVQDAYALALLRNGLIDEARAAISSALRLGTPEATFHLHRALIEHAAGDRCAAHDAFERARAIDPGADPLIAAELASKGIDHHPRAACASRAHAAELEQR